eukprot:maker-scaffold78_size404448-snap-gene-3.33 protein:Tk10222 transcript:maker-scaffold78_size404448-snap-gene-3.33-mRNA-1 annotation:"trna (guanine -n2)-methyltransferase homolog"
MILSFSLVFSRLMLGSEPPRFLFWCSSELVQFRIPEFQALIQLFGLQATWIERDLTQPWIILELPGEAEARQLLSRSLSTKYCIHLWGQGDSLTALHASVQACPREIQTPYFAESVSVKFYVEAFMKKLSLAERVAKIESFDYLPILGPIRLRQPDLILSYFEYYGSDHNHLQPEPSRAFFGRCIGEGQRHLIHRLSIKTRKFIGNTTMDPLLSLFMANLALIKPNDLVLDPFVGTGSIPVAAAHFGAFVMGSDIDYLILHAQTRPSRWQQKHRAIDESMKANFEQYGLGPQYVGVVVADSSKTVWSRPGVFEAILTDPPYGIREPIEKVGTNKKDLVIPEEYLKFHYPQKVDYSISEVFLDLLNFGADYLVEKGRMAFWMPVNREDYAPEKFPTHPNLDLVGNVEQVLSSHTSRRLLIHEKVTRIAGAKASGEHIIPDFREKTPMKTSKWGDKKERQKNRGRINTCEDSSSTVS